MANTRKRVWWKQLLFTAVMLIGVVVALECFGAVMMSMPQYKDYANARLVMMGAVDLEEDSGLYGPQQTLGKPYLLYVPAPNFTNDHGRQNNGNAYRGEPVTVGRQPGKLRVLFMGGSTTYCTAVQRYQDAYPAQVGEILAQSELPPGYDGVEVINAGLPWGTSAEILTHYHFKFHYYQPDIVVINTGCNDAQPAQRATYQPDYSHWRQTVRNIEPLPSHGRWIMRSRFASFFAIHIFAYETLHGKQNFNRMRKTRNESAPAGSWFPPVPKLSAGALNIPRPQLAFHHNMETVIQEILGDGAQVVLVAFRPNPDFSFYKSGSLRWFERHEAILKEFSERFDLEFAPFPASIISPENWYDFCHLHPPGCREKAEHVAPYVLAAARRMAQKSAK